jgi:hypothetical protein
MHRTIMEDSLATTVHKWLYNEPMTANPTLRMLEASEQLIKIRYTLENDIQRRIGSVKICEELSLDPEQPLLKTTFAEAKRSQYFILHIPKGHKEMNHIIRYIFKEWIETYTIDKIVSFKYLPPMDISSIANPVVKTDVKTEYEDYGYFS